MVALSTDGFTKVGVGTATTLAAPGHTIGSTTINVVSTSNWPTDTGVIFAMDATTLVNGVETRTAGTYTEWEGVVTGATTIGSLILREGTDQNYAAGTATRVYIPVASSQVNRQVDTLLAEHKQSGEHSDVNADSVTTTDLTATNSTLTNATITNPTFTNAPDVPDSVDPVVRMSEILFDHIASGCVWTADAAGSTRLASMTSGVCYIDGKRLTVAAVNNRTFTASKDVYVDLHDNGDGTAVPVYTDNTTNAASPALAANSIRCAIVVVGASSIAAATSVNQGQETMVVPIASSIPYCVQDSLGNLICPRDSTRKLLGLRRLASNITVASASLADFSNVMTCPVIIPTGRKAKLSVRGHNQQTSGVAGQSMAKAIYDVTSSVVAIEDVVTGKGTGYGEVCSLEKIYTPPAAGARTFKVQGATSSGTFTIAGIATSPVELRVELE
jgi:hypothetical protein